MIYKDNTNSEVNASLPFREDDDDDGGIKEKENSLWKEFTLF